MPHFSYTIYRTLNLYTYNIFSLTTINFGEKEPKFRIIIYTSYCHKFYYYHNNISHPAIIFPHLLYLLLFNFSLLENHAYDLRYTSY